MTLMPNILLIAGFSPLAPNVHYRLRFSACVDLGASPPPLMFPLSISSFKMHPSLGIPEIVRMICDHVAGTGPGFFDHTEWDERKDLANLARTSKNFYCPAVELLWATQFDLRNLKLPHQMPALGCVDRRCRYSGTLGSVRPTAIYSFMQKLLRPITRDDWDRPLVYAARIRILNMRYPDASSSQLLQTINFPLP